MPLLNSVKHAPSGSIFKSLECIMLLMILGLRNYRKAKNWAKGHLYTLMRSIYPVTFGPLLLVYGGIVKNWQHTLQKMRHHFASHAFLSIQNRLPNSDFQKLAALQKGVNARWRTSPVEYTRREVLLCKSQWRTDLLVPNGSWLNSINALLALSRWFDSWCKF